MIISDFVYMLGKRGVPKGWGVAEYNTPERWFGGSFSEEVYRRSPAESCKRLLDMLRGYYIWMQTSQPVGEERLKTKLA